MKLTFFYAQEQYRRFHTAKMHLLMILLVIAQVVESTSSGLRKKTLKQRPPIFNEPTKEQLSFPSIDVSSASISTSEPTDQEILSSSSSTSQTASPAPTMGPCPLTASVECRVGDGNGKPCSSLSSVPTDEVACTIPPTELGWIYRAGNCDASRSNQIFVCEDRNGGPNSAFKVYITVIGMISGQTYFEGRALPGGQGIPVESFIVKSTNSTLEKSLIAIVRRDSGSGEILQLMKFSVACDTETDLLLGDRFGALELESYRNENAFVKGIERVTWKYSALNAGDTDFHIKEFTAASSRGLSRTDTDTRHRTQCGARIPNIRPRYDELGRSRL